DPGRGGPAGPRRRLRAVLRRRGGHEPGVAVPAAPARGPVLAALPPPARRGVRELRFLGNRAPALGALRRALQPAGGGGGGAAPPPQEPVLDVVLLAGAVLGALQRPGLRGAQA